MKQIIIFLLLIIIGIMGYNVYSKYKRFNPPQSEYSTDANIDLNYHDQQVVGDYHRAIARLNGYVVQQWSFNRIDVRAPKKDNAVTQASVAQYNELMAEVKRNEALLAESAKLKAAGMTNKQIAARQAGTNIQPKKANSKEEMLQNWLAKSPEDFNFGVGAQGPLVFEIQRLLNALGGQITHDGIYRLETANAVEAFEKSKGLYEDGRMDPLTANALLNN